MPRPTVAQLAYGSATVIFSAAAMLLLSQAAAYLAVVAICVTALALGLLVALTAPVARTARAPAAADASVARVPQPSGSSAGTAADRRPVGAQSAHR